MESNSDQSIPSAPSEPRIQPTREQISARARELWQGYGQPAGRDDEIWLEAERQLLGVDAEVADTGGGPVAARRLRQSTSAGPRRHNEKAKREGN